MAAVTIDYIPHKAIDKTKWDACISSAPNGLVYALSHYLDATAITWDALVLNDYEAVMPLPTRKKMGFQYLFEPAFTPTLGVFGREISAQLVTAFLQSIPAAVKFWDYSLNHFNPVEPGKYPAYSRNNFVLPLNNSYEWLQQQYNENTRRNSRKALKMGCVLKKHINIDSIITICEKEMARFTRASPGLFDQLKKIYLQQGDAAVTYGVENEKGVLIASAAFLIFNQRACYWLVGNTAENRKYAASFLLIDSFIKDHQQQPLLLDFEGSDKPGIADFYKKFGAQPEPFTTIYYNKLPFPFSLYKKPPGHYQPSNGQSL